MKRAAGEPRTDRPNNNPSSKKKSEVTKERILEEALQPCSARRASTRPPCARWPEAASLAPGAAYYYFPSKEAILLGYYARNQSQHEVKRPRAPQGSLRDKLSLVLHEKLESVKRERKLLGAAHPAAGRSARFHLRLRQRDARGAPLVDGAVRRALKDEPLSDELKRLLVLALWLLHLGFMLYFIHDRSAQQDKTHRLVDEMLDLLMLLYRRRWPRAAPDHAAPAHAGTRRPDSADVTAVVGVLGFDLQRGVGDLVVAPQHHVDLADQLVAAGWAGRSPGAPTARKGRW